MQSERLLGFSITPKSHMIESHACEQQAELNGIGDLDESFGERDHQVESRGDFGCRCSQNFAMKQRIKIEHHLQTNCNEVKFKIEDMKKKGNESDQPGGKENIRLEEEAIEKRLQRLRGNL